MAKLHNDISNISERITDKNVSVVIDTSGSMYRNFSVIKEASVLLIKSLFQTREHASFNVISFANCCKPFANSLVPLSTENLRLVTSWIHSLDCEANTNTLSALVTALNDDYVDGVVIFTDGLPTQKPSVFFKCIPELAQERPVHCIYVSSGFNDESALQFWKKLVMSTNGSLHLLVTENSQTTESQQVYPYKVHYRDDGYLSTSFSSASSYDVNSSDEESYLHSSRSIKDYGDESKLLGKTVLGKRKSNGYYYKGTITKLIPISSQVEVVFQSSKDVKFQLQQRCYINEIIFYDEAKEHKVYSGDKVLVCLSNRRKYIPATIKKKEYLFDDDDYNGYEKLVHVEMFDNQTKAVPIASVIRISSDHYNNIVKNILQKQASLSRRTVKQLQDDRKLRTSKRNFKTNDVCDDDSILDDTKDYLRNKIEQQLKESQQLLSSLSMRDQEDYYYRPTFHDEDVYDNYDRYEVERYKRMQELRKSLEELHSPELSDQFQHGLLGKGIHYRTKSAQVKFTEPSPPASWNMNSTAQKKSTSKRFRSASVGSNAVERSKKHWVGRPLTKETSPKKHIGRYRSKQSPPTAEEYQTADGVPFPVKTDKRFHDQKTKNWVPGQFKNSGYRHHDIIAHRLVDVNTHRPQPSADHEKQKKYFQDQIRLNRLKTNRAVHEMRKKQETEAKILHVVNRDKQLRKQNEDRRQAGYTKVKITIEKDASKMECKQTNQKEQRQYEKEREQKNQEKKIQTY